MANVFEEDDDPRESEFADTPGDVEELTDAQVEASLEPEIVERSSSVEDPEVVKRFEVAMCYRTLLKGSLFNESNEASKIVEAEARAFFEERLRTLLGMQVAKALPVASQPLPFDEKEIIALKAIARKLVKQSELAEVPVQPVLRQAAVPAPIKQAPAMAPRSVKPLQPRAPLKAAKKPATAPIKAPVDNGVVEDMGKEIIVEGHKRYRMVRNELGTPFKQDITGQGNPIGKVPFPSNQQMEQISAIQSAQQIQKLDIALGGQHVNTNQLVAKVNEGKED